MDVGVPVAAVWRGAAAEAHAVAGGAAVGCRVVARGFGDRAAAVGVAEKGADTAAGGCTVAPAPAASVATGREGGAHGGAERGACWGAAVVGHDLGALDFQRLGSPGSNKT